MNFTANFAPVCARSLFLLLRPPRFSAASSALYPLRTASETFFTRSSLSEITLRTPRIPRSAVERAALFRTSFFLNARNRPVGNFPLRFKHSGSQRIELVCSSLFWFIGLPSSARLPPISMFTYIISDVSALVNTLFKNFSQNM